MLNSKNNVLRFIGALILGYCSTSSAAVIIEQPVASSPDGVESTLDDQAPPSGIESADNFVLSQTTELVSITWWGVYDPDVPTAGDDFTLRIFGDDGGAPGAAHIAEYTGITALSASTGEFDIFGAEIYEYSTSAADGLVLDPGTYYLSLVNVVNLTSDPVIWFWTEGSGGDSANWERDPTIGPDWDPGVPAIDLAYRIEVEPVVGAAPVPPTVLLVFPLLMLIQKRFRS